MPRRRGYARKRTGGRRLSSTVANYGTGPVQSRDRRYTAGVLRGTNKVAALYDAAMMAHDAVKAIHPLIKDIPPMHVPRRPKLKIRNKLPTKGPTKRPTMNRHEKLNQAGTTGPVNKGKGYNTSKDGTVVTHGKGRVPKWKQKRLGLYKYDVWQTILLSKSNRLAASNNVLETFRYPIKAPECLDSERVQSMVFQPFCSHFSGIHSTLYQKVRADGTDLDHSTELLDVIQSKADVARHSLPASVDGVQGSAIIYEGDYLGGAFTAGNARAAGNIAQVHKYYDQLVKQLKIDLVFTASRAFPVEISVSVVRMIDAASPYALSADDKKMLLNNLDNKGMEYSRFKTEWLHKFRLPALMSDKKPPQYSINKILKTNFLQSNVFEKNNVAETMTQAGTTLLGKGIDVRVNEVADGDMSGNFVVLIKHRKVQTPQQFIYKSCVQGVGGGIQVASAEFPALSEQSYDIPVHSGDSMPNSGEPFAVNQGDETKASFYVHGKLVTKWGFRRQPESIPSIVSSDPSHVDYKKSQSLMIAPSYTTDDTYGLYTESPSHVQLAGSTANTGP